uniref:MOB-like protein phocein n=1 Tax=Parastrongyloides trichosuri TaxID=131310 RepID=A0A0N4Z223_PARTI
MESQTAIENTIYRRNECGCRKEDWYKWEPIDFMEMDSTLNIQQFIQQNIHHKKNNNEILEIPEGVNEGVWKYEHLRQFCMQLNGLAVMLQCECNPEGCPQMNATEQWLFLCAAHKEPKSCSAIDYTRHTLDGAATLLNSNRYFPSRVDIKDSSLSKIGSICRRVYRIFAHAYFHHRNCFDEFESETNLCQRFTIFVVKYNLMPQEHLIVPIDSSDTQEGK